MTFDFDEPLDRRASGSEKWDEAVLERIFGRKDVLPLWVADMDFRSPPAAARTLQEHAHAGEFGYRLESNDLLPAIADWYRTRHDMPVDPAHLIQTPGVMSGIAASIQLLSKGGDGVIIQPPVFFEFDKYVRVNHRRVVENPLRLHEGRYTFDLDDLETKAADPATALLILCNPHNPVGRAWTKEELTGLSAVCRKHGVRIISDEIYGDVVFAPHRFVPMAQVDDSVVTCFSPAKTFNVGGIVGGLLHTPEDRLAAQCRALLDSLALTKTNDVANAVTHAVYREGAPWLDEVMNYLAENVNYARQRIDALPGVKLIEPDATFLLWLDLHEAASDVPDLLVNRAQLALGHGALYGTGGIGFARMCIACPRSILAEAFDRLERALSS